MTLRVLVDIGHPAHVHLFKHVIWKIEALGGRTCITTRQKDVTTELLDAYGFEYHLVGHYHRLIDKILSLIKTNYKLLGIARQFNPHVFVTVGSVHAAQVAWIMDRIYLTFVDTEGSMMEGYLTRPFATRIYTPMAFRKSLGRKQVYYDGYHEMTYLLPEYFTPNPSVLSNYGLSPDDTFFIVRMVAWTATHDWQQYGISNLDSIVKHLENYGKVFISAESGLEPHLDRLRVTISPEDMHTMLAYARLYVGEGATMASESASLGTPAIYLNTQALGYIDAEMKAGLVYHIDPTTCSEDRILKRIDQILARPPTYYREKSKKFLKGKVDVADFIVKEIVDLARRKYHL